MPESPESHVDEMNNSSPYTMTEEELQKRLKHGHYGRYITQFYAAMIASTGAISFGTLVGWSSPNLSQFKRHTTTVSRYHHSWIASMVPLGCAVGIMPWSYLNERLGPKLCMTIQGPFNIITWIIMASITEFNTFITCRFFCGVLSVSYLINGEALLVESVHSGNLMHMMVMFRTSIYLGVAITYMLSQVLTTSTLTAGCAFANALHLFLMLFAPDNPVYLYEKNVRKAEQALTWYRGNHNIYSEMQKIQHDAVSKKLDQESSGSMMYAEVVLKGLFIVLGLTFFRVFSGYYIFLFYSVEVVGGSYSHAGYLVHYHTYVIVLLMANLVATVVHYRMPFGVRKPLLVSTSLVMFFLMLITIYLYLPEFLPHLVQYKAVNWVVVVCCCAFAVAYEVGLGSYPEILLYEYMPYQVHLRAKNIAKVVHWFLIFICVRYFLYMQKAMPEYVTFALLTVIALCGIIYCNFFVVEVKGRSLVQIQIDIGGNPIGNRGAYRQRMKSDILDI